MLNIGTGIVEPAFLRFTLTWHNTWSGDFGSSRSHTQSTHCLQTILYCPWQLHLQKCCLRYDTYTMNIFNYHRPPVLTALVKVDSYTDQTQQTRIDWVLLYTSTNFKNTLHFSPFLAQYNILISKYRIVDKLYTDALVFLHYHFFQLKTHINFFKKLEIWVVRKILLVGSIKTHMALTIRSS